MTPLPIALATGAFTIIVGLGLFMAACVFADAFATILGLASDHGEQDQ